MKHDVKEVLLGAAGIAAVVAVVWLCLALYTQQFRSFVSVTMEAPRSGLLMERGADIKLRGARVGHVGVIEPTESGAVLQLELDPDLVDRIPADVRARIVPPTVFGAKYVELIGDSSGDAEPIGSGDVIAAEHVTVEINQTWDAARQALVNLDAPRLNTMLASTAALVEGRGESIGRLVQDADFVFDQLVDEIEPIGEAATRMADLADRYAPAADDLVATLGNSGRIVDNFAEQDVQLAAALRSLVDMSDQLTGFLVVNQASLADTAAVYRPTTALLGRYSPMYQCLLEGVALNDRLLSAVMGGPELGGAHRNGHFTFMVQRSLPPYQYPQDLPVVRAASGPECHGLPSVNGRAPYTRFDIGAHPFRLDREGSELSKELIGIHLFGPEFGEQFGLLRGVDR